MNRPQTKSTEPDEYTQAFAVTKQVLGYIGSFRIPPVPHAYELLYRSIEGGNTVLREEVSYLTDELKSVTLDRVHQLHDQYLSGSEDGTNLNLKLSGFMASEMESLHDFILEQIEANVGFGDSVQLVCDNLGVDELSPERSEELVRVVLAVNQRLRRQLDAFTQHLEESQSQIDNLQKCLLQCQKSALTDPLTGIGNRRFFDTVLSQAVHHSASGEAMYLLLVDVDDFKRINQTFGYETGDAVLRLVAAQMEGIADDASLARHGGDEFSLFAKGIDANFAFDLANRIGRYFADETIVVENSSEIIGRLSLSIGVARLRPDDCQASWYERAARLLKGAKCSGGNCVQVEPSFSAERP